MLCRCPCVRKNTNIWSLASEIKRDNYLKCWYLGSWQGETRISCAQKLFVYLIAIIRCETASVECHHVQFFTEVKTSSPWGSYPGQVILQQEVSKKRKGISAHQCWERKRTLWLQETLNSDRSRVWVRWRIIFKHCCHCYKTKLQISCITGNQGLFCQTFLSSNASLIALLCFQYLSQAVKCI